MAEETDAERIARLEAALEKAEEKITDISDKAENLATAPSKSGWDAFASTYIDKMSFNGQLGVIFAGRWSNSKDGETTTRILDYSIVAFAHFAS